MNPFVKLKLYHRLKQILYKLKNRPKIKSKNCTIGKNVIFGKNVKIFAKNIMIGDGCMIGDNVTINGETFEIGDYGTIYQDCFFPGGEVRIGHNFWLGAGSIIDGRGGTTIGNNVGIGAQSQLWTHMAYGDLMNGCRFFSVKSLEIGNDVWLVGHNLVSPVKINDRSMAMLGSLITKDMMCDRSYAGSPASDITDKIGAQFEEISTREKVDILKSHLISFSEKYGLGDYSRFIKVYENSEDYFDKSDLIQLNIANRSYKKTGSVIEYLLMRNLLPEVKFIPSKVGQLKSSGYEGNL